MPVFSPALFSYYSSKSTMATFFFSSFFHYYYYFFKYGKMKCFFYNVTQVTLRFEQIRENEMFNNVVYSENK